MTDSRAAVGLDRLPWLNDEPRPRAKDGARDLLGWLVAGTMLVAGVSYWMGTRVGGGDDQPAATSAEVPNPAVTVEVPQVRPGEEAQPEVRFEAPPEVRPAPAEEVAVARPRAESAPPRKRPAAAPQAKSQRSQRAKTTAPASAAAPKASPKSGARKLTYWPARQTEGAKGRIVRIGAFGSRHQAKVGWQYMRRSYPAVGRLPAVVVESRNSRGRTFYRFQIGTTSQAHSEVLCQRMQRIHLSCAVVGLPWKPQGVER
jgi:hypothetical protein